jgi:hypothetical protein
MSEPELEMSTRAYCKLIMHSAKYPSCALNGVLLAKREDLRPGSRLIKYTDCIPLFHLGMGLTPMLEVALTQVWGPLQLPLSLCSKELPRLVPWLGFCTSLYLCFLL